MKKMITVVALLAMTFSTAGVAENITFNTVKLADAKGKQSEARLTLNDDNKSIVIQVADRDVATIPYESVEKFSYEYTKKHRVTQGAIVMVASLGAGAIVMLTKSKSHWLYIDYKDQNAAKSLVLRLDKKDYTKVFDAIKAHTGQEVVYLNDGDKPKSKDTKAEPKPDPSGN